MRENTFRKENHRWPSLPTSTPTRVASGEDDPAGELPGPEAPSVPRGRGRVQHLGHTPPGPSGEELGTPDLDPSIRSESHRPLPLPPRTELILEETFAPDCGHREGGVFLLEDTDALGGEKEKVRRWARGPQGTLPGGGAWRAGGRWWGG